MVLEESLQYCGVYHFVLCHSDDEMDFLPINLISEAKASQKNRHYKTHNLFEKWSRFSTSSTKSRPVFLSIAYHNY